MAQEEVNTGNFRWTDELEDCLAELWGEREVLYDVQHPNYHNKGLKNKAYEEICAVLGCSSK